jgi:hypothetical protein
MSDSIFNFGFSRPRRRIEPQMSDESGRDPADQSDAPDQGATDRRDPGTDALKELSRLIGHTDPLPPAGHPDEGPPPGGRLADISRAASSPGDWTRDAFVRPREQPPQGRWREEDRTYDDQSREDGAADDRFRQQRPFEDWSFEGRQSDRGASVRRDRDFARSRQPVQPNNPDTEHSEARDNFDFVQLPDRDDYAVAPRHPTAEEDYHDRDHRESSLTGRRPPPYGRQEDYADEYHEYEYHEEDEETAYHAEHEQPDHHEMGGQKRSTTRVVVAVLGLAVFGTAAAFGYRTIFKAAPSGSASTPIIRADNSPTKITPVAADADVKPTTAVFDDRSKEQLIPRNEEPVDVAAPLGSRAVGTAASSPPNSPRGNAALAGDPKRVRTVPIRADQSEASSSDRSASRSVPPPQSQPRVPPQARQVGAAPQPPLPSPPRQIAAASPPSASPAGDPKGTASVPEQPAATRAIEAGGFVVQLSAQRSEADAQAAFRTLQVKYPALSGREPLIRRKDLGERGIFFATQVGPFGVKSEADQLCETLKTAGASCFVQKN